MANKPRGSVRKRASEDRRAARTKRALSGAMVELMLRKPFDAIRVQDLLDMAHVGRSTFYAHFRNKDDLLLSDWERLLSALDSHFEHERPESRRVAPVRELFAHVRDYRAFRRSVVQSGRNDVLTAIGAGHLARTIDRRLTALAPVRSDEILPRPALARLLGAALMELLEWWMDRDKQYSAEWADERFHRFVWSALGSGKG